MSPADLVDPLFRVPLAAGLAAAAVLPALGALLRLRDEWLAALGLAQLAALGGTLGMLLGAQVLAGAGAGAAAGAAGKSLGGLRGNTSYALMILLGWSGTLLLAANSPRGESLARALTEGQLYFAGAPHAWTLVGIAAICGSALPWLSRRVIQARFFPDYEPANRLRAWPYRLTLELLVAAAIGAATVTLGVMAAFALLFVPPWLAFPLARSWRSALAWSVAIGTGAYLVAFGAALLLDQPFGPVQVVTLLMAGAAGRPAVSFVPQVAA